MPLTGGVESWIGIVNTGRGKRGPVVRAELNRPIRFRRAVICALLKIHATPQEWFRAHLNGACRTQPARRRKAHAGCADTTVYKNPDRNHLVTRFPSHSAPVCVTVRTVCAAPRSIAWL